MPNDPQISAVRFVRPLALFYVALFVSIGIQLPFFPLWLEAKGLDAGMIGLVLAAPMVVRLFSIPILTRLADRHHAVRGAIIIASVLAAAGTIALGFTEGGLAILIVFTLASIPFTPVMPLAEAYALRGLAQVGRAYGPVRLWGSAAFIGGSLGAGWIIDSLAAGNLIWLIAAAMMASAVAAAGLVPLPPHTPVMDAPEPSYEGFLRTPGFAMVAAAAGLIQASHAVYYGFSSLDWKAAGLDGTAVGLLWAIGVAAEITLFAFSGRSPLWLRPPALLLAGALGAGLRWGIMALDPPTAALPFLQCLHGLSFGATHLGAIGFVARAAPSGRAATAQGSLAVVLGGTMALSMGLSGVLYENFGAQAYAGMALLAAAGAACAITARRRRGGSIASTSP
ncbi:MAG: transporter, family, 3-phenylpropionic acid transporter [Alphaproteobacteria bacterium]|nr:transporter, family, 3-phenylpropionic acid transporter [Alphaproteobacteria bacterium]